MEEVKTEGLPLGLGLGLDPEVEFLASKQETGDEWELFKENVRPLKRGRSVTVLNQPLKSYTDSQLKSSLLQTPMNFIEALDEYQGDDPLSPCIDVTVDDEKKSHLQSFLKILPPVEFCCVYGSSLHPNNQDKSSMVDYILGVSDPLQWHSENLRMNKHHYSSRMAYFGGARLITGVAENIGVGVHFNPFVSWDDQMLKYGVVRMHDLVEDILNWERFYLSGRLQKPVHILVDKVQIGNVNSVNLRAAVSAALLLLPSKFSEEELYAKICSLSYMGDLRMLFAEDKNKVKKIVQGQFGLFKSMYKPFLQEYKAKDLLSFSSSGDEHANFSQDCGLLATRCLLHSLPQLVRGKMGMKLGEEKGKCLQEVMIGSREEAARCMTNVLRRTVMISSARQAVSGLVVTGGINAAIYLGKKVRKAWKSWT